MKATRTLVLVVGLVGAISLGGCVPTVLGVLGAMGTAYDPYYGGSFAMSPWGETYDNGSWSSYSSYADYGVYGDANGCVYTADWSNC